MSSGLTNREIVPFALADSGSRWHVRAFDRRKGEFRDFVLTRIADARVYELLAPKFQLFEGVFGASDEVLGAIGSGVDFERRIADIYQNCREPAEIKSSFEQLQLDLSGEINEAMVWSPPVPPTVSRCPKKTQKSCCACPRPCSQRDCSTRPTPTCWPT
nr:WYL domain-containing protein [Acidithiobacillus ferrooxidans]